MRTSAVARVALACATAIAAAAGCSSSSGSKAVRPTLSTTTTIARAPLGDQAAPLAQFTPSEAARVAPPTGADATALVELARGAPPTLAEVVAARQGMDGTLRLPPTPRNVPPSVRAELDAARTVAQRYPTTVEAARAGYRLASRFIPGIGSHWIKWQLVTAPFDPAQPSMLLYDGNGPRAPLAGLSYYTESAAAPAAFSGGGAVWHRHVGLCIVHGVLVGEGITAPGACAAGLLLPGRNIWMLHVWVVPGRPNRSGVFAPVNPGLCSAAAPCSLPPK